MQKNKNLKLIKYWESLDREQKKYLISKTILPIIIQVFEGFSGGCMVQIRNGIHLIEFYTAAERIKYNEYN